MTIIQMHWYTVPYEWKPSSSTLLYLPFTDDLDNHSSQSYSLVSSSSASITTLNGLKCATFSDGYLTFPDTNILNWVYTISLWRKLTENSWATPFVYVGKWTWASNKYYAYWEWTNTYRMSSSYWANDFTVRLSTPTFPTGWEYLVTTVDSNNLWTLYKNATSLWTWNFWTSRAVSSWSLYVWADATAPSTSWARFTWYISNLIIDGKARSQAEITEYYNNTKANYGL